MISVGQTFLVPSGKSGAHLFFIILGPVDIEYSQKQQFLYVNVTTIRENLPYDDACIIRVGEHPFITHESYIAYRHARLDSMRDLEKVCGTVWRQHANCSEQLLSRIREGAKKSRFMRRDLKKLFEA